MQYTYRQTKNATAEFLVLEASSDEEAAEIIASRHADRGAVLVSVKPARP